MNSINEYRHAMRMVEVVERGPINKFSQETRASADLIRSVDHYHREQTDRIQSELTKYKEKIVAYEQDYRAASTEFSIPCPEPGTDAAKLLVAAKLSRQRAARLETENLKLLAEIDEWKNASGLECGGDPDGVTPESCRKYWENIERINTSPVLYWSHVHTDEEDCGWNVLECRPDHPQQPTLRVLRMADNAHGAQVLITCREKDGDEEITIADVIVPQRDDIGNCSICDGKGWIISTFGEGDECPWCKGEGKTAMDEAREIACALYWSWLRSPNGGGRKVISGLLTRREPFNSRETVNTNINNDGTLRRG